MGRRTTAPMLAPAPAALDGGPVLLDLSGCGLGASAAALPAARWLADGPGSRPLWIACPARCACLFADLGARVIVGPVPAGARLRLDCAAALARAAAAPTSSCPVEVLAALAGAHPAVPVFEVPAEQMAAVRRARAQLAGARRLVLLQPIASDPARNWPLARWGRLAARLADGPADCAVAVTHSHAPAWPRRDAAPKVIDLCRLPADRLAAWCAAADLVAGPDSACFHLAAAVGTAAVGVFGPGDGAASARWYPQARVVQAAGAAGLARLPVAAVEDACMEELDRG